MLKVTHTIRRQNLLKNAIQRHVNAEAKTDDWRSMKMCKPSTEMCNTKIFTSIYKLLALPLTWATYKRPKHQKECIKKTVLEVGISKMTAHVTPWSIKYYLCHII